MKAQSVALFGAIVFGTSVAQARTLPQDGTYESFQHGYIGIEKYSATCPAISGTITIDQHQLYPENADFDFDNCLLYLGSLFNSSVAIYDPFAEEMVDILEFDGITHNSALHLGGVGVDKRTGLVSIVVDAANPFNTGGSDVSGKNYIILYDPSTQSVLYNIDLTETTGERYGAFQDVEQDDYGNVYIVGTYPGSILRVEGGPEDPQVVEWYTSFDPNGQIQTTRIGFSGLAVTGDVLLANDNNIGEIVRFDTTAAQGTPTVVPHTPNTQISASDAIYLPPKYDGTVLLVAENSAGVSVLRSQDALWTEAEYLGLIPNNSPDASGGILTATVQIGESIYMVEEFFSDSFNGAGTRAQFPLVDITAQVEALL
ncbi:hypothetical protein BDY21DRAFT_295334 [Lineolata rhizophorae]|uniref:Uncharacterized protein n=1 Tax=Lineolata rhizophorae TaxID=578093 RepID=A0A6A6PDM0_9PEZI|nr:hypothetical protein BDY21DRAFT_295334 [Lineolata rhizophorae]